MSGPNPWEVLHFRKQLKKYEETGISESMKILKKLRDLKLDNQMLQTVQITRTLLYIRNRLKNTEDEEKSKLSKMCKCLISEWKKQIEGNPENQTKKNNDIQPV